VKPIRAVSSALLLLLVVPLLAGCLRVQASLGLGEDDRVSGQIVAASVPTGAEDPGPQLEVPTSLQGRKIEVSPYDQDGYKGTKVFFEGLTFGDISSLAAMTEESGRRVKATLVRSGDIVTLDARIDLEDVPRNGTDVQFMMAFPARVATTNGTREGESIVKWNLPAGEVTTMKAEVRYADPSTRSFSGWVAIVAGVAIGVSIVVAALAWLNRNRRDGDNADQPPVGASTSA
jgi:hypothetical protein